MAVVTRDSHARLDESTHHYPAFPSSRSLHPSQVELFYDVDLDEFTVLFFGKNRPHSVDETGENMYRLIDSKTGEWVGVELHNFVKKVLPRHPSLGSGLSVATIISDAAYDTDHRQTATGDGILYRLYEGWKRLVTPRRLEVRELLSDLRDLSTTEITLQP